MVSIGQWLALGGRPDYWDHVERTVRNHIARSQFTLTPAFLELFNRLHADKPRETVDAAIAELRKLEGGFVSQSMFDDWVSFPDTLGKPGLYPNGIQMMGCCPPEGMRALWEAFNSTVILDDESLFVNMRFSIDHQSALVEAYRPEDGRLDVRIQTDRKCFLRPPAWVNRNEVVAYRNRREITTQWGGPRDAYVAFKHVVRGDRLSIAWPVPSFTQVFVPASVPGRSDEVRVKWVGDRVAGIEPRGQYLPMYAGE